ATSIAWGLWEQSGGMASALEGSEVRRMNRSGVSALTVTEGLALFDTALAADRAALVPIRLDLAALRAEGDVPPLLSRLVKARARRAAAVGSAGATALRERLVTLAEPERQAVLLDLVATQVAAVLGFARVEEVEADRAFRDLGFDSLTAVELRNQLGAATGLQLPATLVFDYPSTAELVTHISAELPGSQGASPVFGELDRLAEALAAAQPDSGQRARVTARLRTLLAAWSEGDTPADGEDVPGSIESASDDEIFDFIGKEFGIS
ncbi:phosphopantetheine-binding protein, partial [Streptomyces sp. ISL-94]|uniref:phosphopantetheine-binding protein n=1 Tax=Streptomyces sp. ISL-94 TaxID=2819190 RepID=UPI0020350284